MNYEKDLSTLLWKSGNRGTSTGHVLLINVPTI